jgi:enoyl-CoA hydratase/carnithine racemase
MANRGYYKKPGVSVMEFDGEACENLSRELWEQSEQINYDTCVQAVVITGSRKNVFCISDAGQFKRRRSPFSLANPISAIRCPVVAAINGRAEGAGAAIALACDIRIASETATFSFPYIKHDVIPSDGVTQRLPRLVGQAKALELLLTGDEIDAREALRIGLISHIVKASELLPEAIALAVRLSEQASIAVNYCKEAVLKGMDMTLEQGLRLEGDLYFLLHTTGDRTEGITAFKEKRKPKFKGK